MKMNARVYVMRSSDGLLKIGCSRNPDQRRKSIQSDSQQSIELLYVSDVVERVELAERLAQRMMAEAGRHVNREWFSGDGGEAVACVRSAITRASDAPEGLENLRRSTFDGGRIVDAPTVVQVRIRKEDESALDDMRRADPDLPSRAELLRRLFEKEVERINRRNKK